MKTFKNRILHFLKINWANLIVFVIVFCGAFLLLASQWIKSNFETSDFGIILFHLRFPLLGNGVPLVASFIFKVVCASLLIAFCVSYTKLAISFIRFAYNISTNLIGKISTSKLTTFKVVFSIALFALCANIVVNRFHIKDYVRTQTQYSQLYENHYKPFDSANLAGFTPKQNLIIILVESLESNLILQTSENEGGGGNRLI